MDTTRYQVAIEAELSALEDELKTIGIHDPKNTKDWITMTADMDNVSADPNDVADKTEEWVERRGTVAQLETRYNNLVRALEKIEQGTYGTCEVCNADIEIERLDANPSARTCIEHKDKESELSQ